MIRVGDHVLVYTTKNQQHDLRNISVKCSNIINSI